MAAVPAGGRTHVPRVAWPAGAICLVALGLAAVVLAEAMPPARWLAAALSPAMDRMDELVFAYAVVPRMVGAVVAGAMLGLAGAVFQQVLRNPLAAPDTLGVSGGAELCLALVTLAYPAAAAFGPGPISFGGGLATVGLVLAISARHRFAPASILLTGLVVGLYLKSITTLLVLSHPFDLSGVLLWAGGSLAVQDWLPVTHLALWGALMLALLLVLARSLALFSLDDASVRALGGGVGPSRLAGLAVAVGLTAGVTGTFGAIGFIGLAAPAFARLSGVRRFGPRLAWSAILGAALLWATDGGATLLTHHAGLEVPTGAGAALLGAPLLVWLATRQHQAAVEATGAVQSRRHPRQALLLAVLGLATVAVVALALLIGRNATEWSFTWPGPDLDMLLPWRGPRTVAAAAAGAILALSGFVLQRLSGNDIAAPEMLGLGAGAGAGILIATLLGLEPALSAVAAVVGVLIVAALLLAWLGTGRVTPDRLLVSGLALTAATGSLVGIFAATGDPRAVGVIAWITGSTYRIGAAGAAWAGAGAATGAIALVFASRWLDLMPLGVASRQAFGLPERRAQASLTIMAAFLAGFGTLVVGPLSFVGLVGPRLAASLGLQRALPQGIGAMACGALLMVLADIVGRTAAVPTQIPSGIAAALIGSPALIALLARRTR